MRGRIEIFIERNDLNALSTKKVVDHNVYVHSVNNQMDSVFIVMVCDDRCEEGQ